MLTHCKRIVLTFKIIVRMPFTHTTMQNCLLVPTMTRTFANCAGFMNLLYFWKSTHNPSNANRDHNMFLD